MGNTDSIPVISQGKSLVQFISGDSAGALATQQNFAYNNTFPVISQIASAGYAIGGDMERAENLQKRFADDMLRVIDSIPVAGHVKGTVHYALGENEKGDESMKAASRSTGVVLGGVGGFAVGGPVGAVAGGLAGGAAMDGVITGSEILLNGEDAKPHGYVAIGHEIASAVKDPSKEITVSEGFDMAMQPIADGLGGLAGGKMIGKPLGLGKAASGKMTLPIPASGGRYVRPGFGKTIGALPGDEVPLMAPKPNRLGLDRAGLDNRANQLNPNHARSGPGRPAGYPGEGSLADLNNHANQLNPNNQIFQG